MAIWWDKKWGKNKVCGITFSRLRPGKSNDGYSYVIYLKCNHGFYRKPLGEWVIKCIREYEKEPSCPICRKKFSVNLML